MNTASSLVPTPSRRRLYLMRHGSVTYFRPDGSPIAPDHVPLNDAGIRQARAAGQLFSEQGVTFDRILVSGLPRTVQTADEVLRVLGDGGRGSAIEHVPDLQEIRPGRLRDIPFEELHESFMGVLSGTAAPETKFMGGESVGELLDRVTPAVDAIRQDLSWQSALAVLHGGVNRAILSYLLSGERKLLGGFEQSPACINVIDIGNSPRDVILRATNLSPTDWLQHHTRSSTMEVLFAQYARSNAEHSSTQS